MYFEFKKYKNNLNVLLDQIFRQIEYQTYCLKQQNGDEKWGRVREFCSIVGKQLTVSSVKNRASFFFYFLNLIDLYWGNQEDDFNGGGISLKEFLDQITLNSVADKNEKSGSSIYKANCHIPGI